MNQIMKFPKWVFTIWAINGPALVVASIVFQIVLTWNLAAIVICVSVLLGLIMWLHPIIEVVSQKPGQFFEPKSVFRYSAEYRQYMKDTKSLRKL